jgi:hypothetical protein
MHDGVRVTALDANHVKALFPADEFRSLTRAFVEVSLVETRQCEIVKLIDIQENVIPYSFWVLILSLTSTINRFRSTHIIFNDSLLPKLTSIMGLPTHIRRVFIIHTAEQLPVGPFAGGIPGGACFRREHRLLKEVDNV